MILKFRSALLKTSRQLFRFVSTTHPPQEKNPSFVQGFTRPYVRRADLITLVDCDTMSLAESKNYAKAIGLAMAERTSMIMGLEMGNVGKGGGRCLT